MHAKAKKWDAEYGQRWGDLLPMGRPCDWCGEPVTMGYLHYECTWVELDALNKEAEARAEARRKLGVRRRGTNARIYNKLAKEALTPKEGEGKLGINKESSHAAASLSSESP